jgi:branched-chain amino acid transport system permease protein
VIPAYLLALVPGLVTLAGLSLVIEMTFRLTARGSGDTAMSFFHVPLDAATMLPWGVAALLAGGGFWLFRRSWPGVAAAWSDALAAARRGSGAA